MHRFLAALTLLPALVLGACCCPGSAAGASPALRRSEPVEPAPARTAAIYHGDTGKAADLEQVLPAWKDVDLVAFGEIHGHPVGAAMELLVLGAMAEQDRPVALAMEFFERDTQADLDAYLAGSLDKAAFVKRTRRNKQYAATHGPLIDFCKAHKIPVIAANAPRRLVSGYRKSKKSYEAYRAGLTEEERGWLPEETVEIEDDYRKTFMKLMGPERGRRLFPAQSLWDDAMAEAIVDFREEHPNHRVLLVVGGFHVQRGLGTITKYLMRRGRDEVRVISMQVDKDPALRFAERDAGLGDLVLKVPASRRK